MMSWFDFMVATRGYRFYKNGKLIEKYFLYDLIKDREDFYDIINGNSMYIERRDAEGWRNGKCYFLWDISDNGKIFKRKTSVPQ